MYGTNGNSFVAMVEFGKDSVRARAVTAGGESGDPRSPHFNDQAERYATGNLRDGLLLSRPAQGTHRSGRTIPGSDANQARAAGAAAPAAATPWRRRAYASTE